jgi:transcriptional antiterminator NusG
MLSISGRLSSLRYQAIVAMVDERGVIGRSDIFVGDDRVIVTSGPLPHYEGHISRIDRRKGRARVLFQFDGQRRYADLAVNLLEKVGGEARNGILFWKQSIGNTIFE